MLVVLPFSSLLIDTYYGECSVSSSGYISVVGAELVVLASFGLPIHQLLLRECSSGTTRTSTYVGTVTVPSFPFSDYCPFVEPVTLLWVWILGRVVASLEMPASLLDALLNLRPVECWYLYTTGAGSFVEVILAVELAEVLSEGEFVVCFSYLRFPIFWFRHCTIRFFGSSSEVY